MANITNYLNKIKTAVYGKDVRGAIHDAIKQVYDDASVNHDNANMEVKMARGTHNTLNDRLDNVDEIQAQTNAQLSDIIANNLTVSVKDYGALGDGVTDDTQAFINALNALKPNGGYLFIPKTPNFYRITNQIEITNEHGYVVVYGEGKSSHIKLTQKSSNGHLIGFLGTTGSKLNGGCAKDLHLSTYLSETNQDDNCIGTMYSDNIVFDNIYVSECTWKGITAQRGVTNFKIKNCYVENCKEAGITVEFSDCENIYIENSTVKNIDKIGVHITNAGDVNKMNNVYITNVTVDGCSEHNVACSGIDNGHIDKLSSLSSQNGHGIQIYNSLNISIDKCDVRNNGYAGINVQNSNNVTIYKTVSKFNSISDLEKRGNVFVRQDSSNVKIIDSDISEGVRAFSSQNDELTLFNTLYKGATNNPVIPVIRELDNTNSIALIKSGDWTDIDTSLYAPMQVRHRNGFIHIIGALQGGNISPGQSLAIIPEGFRPLFNHQYSVKCIANGVADFALIRCDKDGRIVIEKTPVGTTEIYLGVSYLL
ncbi:right-handed parallel beta-helix repeat-containing protein [Turicibacter sp. T129]|uniref:right-handed parallel beta-helix repeat-containing protein n=1 Tax=Turicibacter sp. T129 TaxID=2951141 RepID=UPI0021D4D0A0|nr:right-handed parallel beta-helix repeat-containing protein [Turicibacter sp. T129]MCU7193874.1 right-handed parallel beta-helix repeat-containing protein [Turicibacter sp. T129]